MTINHNPFIGSWFSDVTGVNIDLSQVPVSSSPAMNPTKASSTSTYVFYAVGGLALLGAVYLATKK